MNEVVSVNSENTAPNTVFDVVALNMRDLEQRVSGDDGDLIRAIGGDGGVIPDLVREAVMLIVDVLEWLYEVGKQAERRLIPIDAAAASIEVVATAVSSVGEGLDSEGFPPELGFAREIVEKISDLLQQGGGVIQTGADLLSILPSPAALAAIKLEIEKGLGKRVNPKSERDGSLTALLLDISAT